MTINYFPDLVQGSDDWMQTRCGILTASEMKLILTPTLKIASNDKERQHLYELAAQRLTGHVEPHYISDDMIRGQEDEVTARILYSERYSQKVTDMGFITSDELGFPIGFSPDGLVGDDGFIECKSRRQKYQFQTIVENVSEDTMPEEYSLQVQTGLLVSGRKWCDFISYCGGMPMATIRVYPDQEIQAAICQAATAFENRMQEKLAKYIALTQSTKVRLIPTERKIEEEIEIL